MKYYIFNKKSSITLGMVSIVLLLAGAIYILSTGNEQPIVDIPAPPRDNSVDRVFIKGSNELDTLTKTTQQQIENTLYGRVSLDNPGLYTGTVRQGSYSRVAKGKAVVTKFLIDVEPAYLSYNVTVTTIQENNSISIICSPKAQQLDPSAKCEDSEYT